MELKYEDANISELIKERLEEAGIRYWANDNISSVLEEGDKEKVPQPSQPILMSKADLKDLVKS